MRHFRGVLKMLRRNETAFGFNYCFGTKRQEFSKLKQKIALRTFDDERCFINAHESALCGHCEYGREYNHVDIFAKAMRANDLFK